MTTETATNKEFAVIASGGKQYVVSVGDVVDVELLGVQDGDKVEFDQVLMKNDTVGTPTVSGAKVKATVVEQVKANKISIIRYKAKSNRDRKIGHRQKLTRIKIESI